MSNFEVCASQNDDWVGTVRIRLSDHRASSDPPLLMLDIALIAGKCSWGKYISAISREQTLESISLDGGFETVKKLQENDHKNFWTSVEVHNYYTECNVLVLPRQGLVAKLTNEF